MILEERFRIIKHQALTGGGRDSGRESEVRRGRTDNRGQKSGVGGQKSGKDRDQRSYDGGREGTENRK